MDFALLDHQRYQLSRVNPTSAEAFIIRVYRQENKEGFIKAFSDQPEQFVSGFAPLQRTMKLLYLRHVHLWPRFHLIIAEGLEKHRADVVELRHPLSQRMEAIQQAVIECMDACLMELRRSNPTVSLLGCCSGNVAYYYEIVKALFLMV